MDKNKLEHNHGPAIKASSDCPACAVESPGVVELSKTLGAMIWGKR